MKKEQKVKPLAHAFVATVLQKVPTVPQGCHHDNGCLMSGRNTEASRYG